jgi:hypothetical protein
MSDALAAYVPDKLSKDGKEIAEQLLRGFEDITKKAARLGALLVSMSDEDRALFIAGFPAHYRRIWQSLLLVGKGEMHPRLVTATGRAAQVLKRLPYQEQEQYIVELIPVVVGDGPRAIRHYDIENLPPDLMPQVFAQGGGATRVRSVQEQRDWRAQTAKRREAEAAKKETTEINRPNRWAIRKGRAYLAPAKVNAGLTLEDVERLRADLKL